VIQASVCTRIAADRWNEYITEEIVSARDRLADFCVRKGRRPRLDTLRLVVHVPSFWSPDPYDFWGSVGWRVELQ